MKPFSLPRGWIVALAIIINLAVIGGVVWLVVWAVKTLAAAL